MENTIKQILSKTKFYKLHPMTDVVIDGNILIMNIANSNIFINRNYAQMIFAELSNITKIIINKQTIERKKTSEELYQEERNKYKIGSYGEVLQKCDNYIDAISMFNELSIKAQQECAAWSNKVYQGNKNIVFVNKDEVNEFSTTIGAINERKKQNTINRLNKQSKEYLKYINILKERINIE